jgi:5'-nucleotidase
MLRRSLIWIAALAALPAYADDFELTVLHTNDLHAHVEEFRSSGTTLGGYARQATLIKRLRADAKHSILINAGDTFQGTLYFNAYEGLADLAYMNAIGYDAMAAGNHEFDKGPATFAAFIKNANFPIVSSNADYSTDPDLKGLIPKTAVLMKGGEKIGIVGAITPILPTISSPGDNVKMLDITKSLQDSIDDLTRLGVNKIIVLSHVGYQPEKALVRSLRGVDMVVGGHSHTLLGKIKLPESTIEGGGAYPTVVKNADGDTTLVVQAWDWGKVVGQIRVIFDDEGVIKSWRDAKPFAVTQEIPEDITIKSMVEAFKKPIESLKNQPTGEVSEAIARGAAGEGTSPMGKVITDAVLAQVKSQGALAAFVNGGGVRAGLEPGPTSYGDLIQVQPFGNTVVLLDVTGAELKAALEHGVRDLPAHSGGFLHISAGSGYDVDAQKPAGSRISNIVLSGQKVTPEGVYRVALPNFVANGGDAHAELKAARGRRVDTGIVDLDALIEYFKANSPVSPPTDTRIRLLGL